MTMFNDLRSMVAEHHAFYEVLPQYVLVEQGHGSSTARMVKVQSGFDVEIYGANIKDDLAMPGHDPDYALGCAALQEVTDNVSRLASGSCFLEIISFPSTVVIDNRSGSKVEGMFRIRISHRRGLDQPAGRPEQQALEQVEMQLHDLGVVRR